MITIDHSEAYPYAYYDDQEGVTSANNPEFWYALGMIKPHYPVPATRFNAITATSYVCFETFDNELTITHYLLDFT